MSKTTRAKAPVAKKPAIEKLGAKKPAIEKVGAKKTLKKTVYVEMGALEPSPTKASRVAPKKRLVHPKFGEIPVHVDYEIEQLRAQGFGEDIDELLARDDWGDWSQFFFKLGLFDKSRVRHLLSQEIYLNKVLVGDAVECKKCHKETVNLFPFQTRGSDEGTTIFGSCSNCGMMGRYYG